MTTIALPHPSKTNVDVRAHGSMPVALANVLIRYNITADSRKAMPVEVIAPHVLPAFIERPDSPKQEVLPAGPPSEASLRKSSPRHYQAAGASISLDVFHFAIRIAECSVMLHCEVAAETLIAARALVRKLPNLRYVREVTVPGVLRLGRMHDDQRCDAIADAAFVTAS